MGKVCDHTSVGMLVRRDGKLLLIERGRPPYAFAPPAGHCDGDDFPSAAKRELLEEVGLTTQSIKLIAEGRKENPCRREDGSWHHWQIFEVEASGEIERSKEETKQTKWVGIDELKVLAKRTEEYHARKIAQEEWNKNSGLEPVWYDWFKELKVI